MPDREKVIKGLECCVTMPDIYPHCEECPYADAEGTCANMNGLHRDALALLKAQEPMEMSDAELMDAIRKAPIIVKPAVDAAPVVHGRWVKMTGMMPPEYHGHYECSECRWHMRGLRNSWTREEELNYCPNCGAKMDKEE